jgi:hypothetical protein
MVIRRYKDLWFQEYERLSNEHPSVDPDVLAEQANDAAADRLADMIDAAADDR